VLEVAKIKLRTYERGRMTIGDYAVMFTVSQDGKTLGRDPLAVNPLSAIALATESERGDAILIPLSDP